MQTPRPLRFAAALFAALVLIALGAASALAAGPPENDNFADARILPTVNNTAFIEGTTNLSTLETGEPTQSGSGVNGSVWYEFTPYKSGTARVNSCNTFAPDETISVFTGNALTGLSSVASGRHNCPYSNGPSTGKFAVTKGTTYRIQFASPTGGNFHGGVDFSTTSLSPGNDDLADAQLLTGSLPISVETSNYLASGQAGETGYDVYGPNNSIWFKYTIPSDGIYSFDTCSSKDEGQDTVVTVYTSASSTPTTSDLVNAAQNDDACENFANNRLSNVTNEFTAGTTLWIQLVNYDSEYGNPLTLHVHRVTVPEANGSPPMMGGTLKPGGTANVSEGDWLDAAAFAYQWMRCDEGDCVDIDGATGDTYGVTAGDLGFELRVRVTATNGSGSASQLSKISKTVDDVPENDDIANATDLGNAASVVRESDDFFATYEGDDEPDIAGGYRPSSVWYAWTAPADGEYLISTCGAIENGINAPYVDAFTSSTDPGGPTTLTEVASSTAQCDGNFRIGHEAKLTADAGTKYWIGVGSNGGEDTAFRLTISPGAKPAFTTAPSISGTVTPGTELTASPGSVDPAGSFNLGWYICDRNHDNCEDAHSSGYTFFVYDLPAHGSVKFVVEANNGFGTETASAFIDSPPPTDDGPGDSGGSGGSDSTPPIAKPADPLKIVAPSSLGSFKAGKKGVLSFKKLNLSCGSSATGACTGSAKLTAKIKGKTVKLGTAKVAINAGGSLVLKLKLSKSGLKALKKAKKLKATLTIVASAPGYLSQTTAVKLTLKP